MPAIAFVLIGFGAGLVAMIIISLYRSFFKIWNEGLDKKL